VSILKEISQGGLFLWNDDYFVTNFE